MARRVKPANVNALVYARHGRELVSIQKRSFCPISALCSKNNPRDIRPAVIFFACLDLEQKSSFLYGHELMGLKSPVSVSGKVPL